MTHCNLVSKSPKTRGYTNSFVVLRLADGTWVARSGTEEKYYEAWFLLKPSRKEALAALEFAKELHG